MELRTRGRESEKELGFASEWSQRKEVSPRGCRGAEYSQGQDNQNLEDEGNGGFGNGVAAARERKLSEIRFFFVWMKSDVKGPELMGNSTPNNCPTLDQNLSKIKG